MRTALIAGAAVGLVLTGAAVAYVARDSDEAESESAEELRYGDRDVSAPEPLGSQPGPSGDGGTRIERATCGHPYLPDQIGDRVTFERRFEGHAERFVMESLGAVERGDGAMVNEWELTFRGTTQLLRRRCRPQESADDPHYGWIPGMGGEEVIDTTTVWALPWAIELGSRWNGRTSTALRIQGLQDEPAAVLASERDHRVVGRERITVPGGTFDAWHVEFTAQESMDSEPAEEVHGEMWIARDVGMVRERVQETEHQVAEMVVTSWTPGVDDP